ncbi:MAG: HAD family hydrolase [Phycisphaerae bacterium]
MKNASAMAENSDSKVRAIVFDLDDTLFAERDYIRSGYHAVAEHLRDTSGRDEPFEQWLWKRFLAGQSDRAFDALNEQFDLGLSEEGIRELVGVYRSHRPDITAYEGAAEMLARFRPAYHLGLLSDGYMPAQRLKLSAIGLERFFDAVVFTEELGREAWKPSEAGFELISKQLDVPHKHCAYVADNPAKDFVAPNRLGWRTVQFLRPGQIHVHKPAPERGRPQHVVYLFGDIHKVLARGRGPIR